MSLSPPHGPFECLRTIRSTPQIIATFPAEKTHSCRRSVIRLFLVALTKPAQAPFLRRFCQRFQMRLGASPGFVCCSQSLSAESPETPADHRRMSGAESGLSRCNSAGITSTHGSSVRQPPVERSLTHQRRPVISDQTECHQPDIHRPADQ